MSATSCLGECCIPARPAETCHLHGRFQLHQVSLGFYPQKCRYDQKHDSPPRAAESGLWQSSHGQCRMSHPSSSFRSAGLGSIKRWKGLHCGHFDIPTCRWCWRQYHDCRCCRTVDHALPPAPKCTILCKDRCCLQLRHPHKSSRFWTYFNSPVRGWSIKLHRGDTINTIVAHCTLVLSPQKCDAKLRVIVYSGLLSLSGSCFKVQLQIGHSTIFGCVGMSNIFDSQELNRSIEVELLLPAPPSSRVSSAVAAEAD